MRSGVVRTTKPTQNTKFLGAFIQLKWRREGGFVGNTNRTKTPKQFVGRVKVVLTEVIFSSKSKHQDKD